MTDTSPSSAENSAQLTSDSRLLTIYRAARGGVAGIWIYHGLVPKFIFRDWSEMTLLRNMGLDIQMLPSALSAVAILEIGFGMLVLAAWKSRWPLWATIGAMLGSLVSLAQHSPAILHAAFNPVTLNAAVVLLATIALIALPDSRRPMPGSGS